MSARFDLGELFGTPSWSTGELRRNRRSSAVSAAWDANAISDRAAHGA